MTYDAQSGLNFPPCLAVFKTVSKAALALLDLKEASLFGRGLSASPLSLALSWGWVASKNSDLKE